MWADVLLGPTAGQPGWLSRRICGVREHGLKAVNYMLAEAFALMAWC